MASFTKIDQFVEDLALGVHNLDADTLKVALSNQAPTVATDAVLNDISELGAGNGYTAGGETVANNAASETSGVLTLSGDDVTFTATADSIGPFRYAYLYNDTPTSPADPLIGVWDYGEEITLNEDESLLVDFGAAILTVT
jgi:hypothetical protein